MITKMISAFHSQTSLLNDLVSLGVRKGDGLFVHASMREIGFAIGGPRTVVETLLASVGEAGLVGMPGFSADAYFPSGVDRSDLTPTHIAHIEENVPGFDTAKSPTSGMGIIAEIFRTWPDTQRSDHPAVSVCLNGAQAGNFLKEHSLAWATGAETPLGALCARPSMKILLIGVGWNRCSAFHTAESRAAHKRTKTRRFKTGGIDGSWIETPDVADDLDRLFPAVGKAFEQTGAVSYGAFGDAECKICDYRDLVDFASDLIDRANEKSGDLA